MLWYAGANTWTLILVSLPYFDSTVLKWNIEDHTCGKKKDWKLNWAYQLIQCACLSISKTKYPCAVYCDNINTLLLFTLLSTKACLHRFDSGEVSALHIITWNLKHTYLLLISTCPPSCNFISLIAEKCKVLSNYSVTAHTLFHYCLYSSVSKTLCGRRCDLNET